MMKESFVALTLLRFPPSTLQTFLSGITSSSFAAKLRAQVFVLLRLMASCFVGYSWREADIVDFSLVLRRAKRSLAHNALVAFPYIVLELWFYLSRYPLFALGYVTLGSCLVVFKVRHCLLHDYHLKKFSSYANYFFKVAICLIILELNLTLSFLILPYLFCDQDMPNHKLEITKCYDKNCHFITTSFPSECFNHTWFSLIEKNLLEFPVFSPNTTNTAIVYRASPVYLLNMAFIHVWTLMRQICTDGFFAINSFEAFFSLMILLFGYLTFGWILPGKVCSDLMQDEMRNMELEDDLSIVSTYCRIEHFSSKKEQRLRQYYEGRFRYQNAFLSSEEFFQLPFRHQKNILNHSYAPFIKSTRIFREIDNTVISAICHKLRVQLYLMGDNIILPATVPPGLCILLEGTMLAIAPSPINSAAAVRLKRGDVFGELSICFRLATPLLIVAETNCRVLILHRDDFSAISSFIPQKTRKAVILNHRGILDSTVCIFHESKEIMTPPGLKRAVRLFWINQHREFPLYLFFNHNKENETCHVPKKVAIGWICMVSIAALASFPATFDELYSENVLELLWPQNIFAISTSDPVENGVSVKWPKGRGSS